VTSVFRIVLALAMVIFLSSCKNPLGDKNVVDEGYVTSPTGGGDSGGGNPDGAINSAPTISSVADQIIVENTSTAALAVLINDAEDSLDCATSISLSSTDPSLISAGGVVFSGTVPNCTATLTPSANEIGSATVTLTVDDGTLSSQTSFDLTSNRELILNAGSFEFTNGSQALSCLDYLNSSFYDSEGDATYWIDSDGAGGAAPFETFCDMTTQGGGWTLVVKYDSSEATAGAYVLEAEAGRSNINISALSSLNASGVLTASTDMRPFVTSGATHIMHVGKTNDAATDSSTYVRVYFSDVYQSVIDDPNNLFNSTLDTNDPEAVSGTVVAGVSALRKDRWYEDDFSVMTAFDSTGSTTTNFRIDGGEGAAMFTNGSREGAVYCSGSAATAVGHASPKVQWGFVGKDGTTQIYGGSTFIGTYCHPSLGAAQCQPESQINMMFVR